jgi:hypothetical protein
VCKFGTGLLRLECGCMHDLCGLGEWHGAESEAKDWYLQHSLGSRTFGFWERAKEGEGGHGTSVPEGSIIVFNRTSDHSGFQYKGAWRGRSTAVGC